MSTSSSTISNRERICLHECGHALATVRLGTRTFGHIWVGADDASGGISWRGHWAETPRTAEEARVLANCLTEVVAGYVAVRLFAAGDGADGRGDADWGGSDAAKATRYAAALCRYDRSVRHPAAPAGTVPDQLRWAETAAAQLL